MFLTPRCWNLGFPNFWSLRVSLLFPGAWPAWPEVLGSWEGTCSACLGWGLRVGTACLGVGHFSARCAAQGTWGRTPSSALRSLLSEQTKLGITQLPDVNNKPGHASSSWERFRSILGIPVKALNLSCVPAKD